MSASAQKQVDALLREHGFRLVRQTKHHVWRNPQGKVFVTPSTPSDWRAWRNRLTDLKKVIASDPVPEVIAISEHERRQALEKIAAQEKKVAGARGAAKSKGCGFTYIDKKPEAVSTRPPEEKLAEREQRAWESLVRETRREFVENITAKYKALLPKFKEDLQRRFQIYADTRLRRDVEATWHLSYAKAKYPMLYQLRALMERYPITKRYPVTELGDFRRRCEECSKCQKGADYVTFCVDHAYENARAFASSIGRFMPFATHEEIAKAAAKMFNERMQGKGPPVVAGILMRFAARKAHELTVQLLTARPKREAA